MNNLQYKIPPRTDTFIISSVNPKGYCTPAGANQFLSDALEQWVDHQVELDRWSPITEEAWRYTTKMVKYYCSNLRIKNCDEDSMRKFIHDYVNDHDVTVAAHSTADKILQQLRTFFLTLEGVSIIKSPVPKKALDYFFRKERQSIVKDKYVLTDEEFRKLKQLINPKCQFKLEKK